MSKRYLVLCTVLLATIVLSFAGCGKKPSADKAEPTPIPQITEAEGEKIPDKAVDKTVGKRTAEQPDQPKLRITVAVPVTDEAADTMLKLNTLEELLAAVDSKDPVIRAAVADKLLRRNSPAATEALKKLLQDPIEDVRYTAAAGLIDMEDEAVALDLAQIAIHDPSEEVRLEVITNLAFADPPAATVPVLEVAIKDQVAQVREEAVAVLADLFVVEAIPVLIEAIKDRDANVRGVALEALQFITQLTHGAEYDKWKQWWDTEGADFSLDEEKWAEEIIE